MQRRQITIPKEVRERLGVDAGDRLEFVEQERGVYRVVAATRDIRHLKGLIQKPAKPVVVRYITQDDARQAAAATRLFERVLSAENPGSISLVTLCEIAWVLTECYGALRAWDRSSADFSDALVGQVLAAQGCERIVTFDKAAAKLPGFDLLV